MAEWMNEGMHGPCEDDGGGECNLFISKMLTENEVSACRSPSMHDVATGLTSARPQKT